MARVDRDIVLARTDLRKLATDICGPPRGRGRSAAWHCPDPAHPDNDPSMGIFRAASGFDRWKCHACGQCGTAVDLLTLATGATVGEALRDLAARVGLPSDNRPAPPKRRPAPSTTAATPPASAAAPVDPAVDALVTAAAGLLWEPIGAGARVFLHRRGFTDQVLRANRVGFDPGPRHLPRPHGLPRRGPGIAFPALSPRDGRAAYYQLRYLDPRRTSRKYDQPTATLAPNPRLAAVVPAGPSRPGIVVVCEGFPDALAAAHVGLAAAAVLGVAHASPSGADRLADALLARYPAAAFAICFDADERADPHHSPVGQDAADRLAHSLGERGAAVAITPPAAPHKDLNDWWRCDPAAVADQLTRTAGQLVPGHLPPPPDTVAAAPPLGM